ncbi:MAG: acetate--CoA ligase family protein [Candidatus Gracilibacteria bacterium]|nr:acetate--CoA ligase family protein [Candidatus Gracilibacteria bacterium]
MNFFDIKSVAIIGASEVEGKIGNTLLKNLSNFSGNKYGVNPKGGNFEEIDFYKYISLLPEIVDVAVFAIPANFVEESFLEVAKFGIKRVIIISAGFKEIGNLEGENKLKNIANEYDISLLGPNCLGYFDVTNNLNLSFGVKDIRSGNIGVISQSGAIAVALCDWANNKNLGFSKIISMGNKAGIDEVDFLLELEKDENTKVIALYLESLERGELFYEIAKRVSKNKPIILIKSGVSNLGQKAAISHTGALSSDKKILDSAFLHSNIHSTNSLEDFFSMIEIFSKVDYKNIPEELAIITNAGGPGVVTTDHCEFNDIVLSQFNDEEKEILKVGLSSSSSVSNPIDIIGDATSKTYSQILNNFSKIVQKRAMLLLLTAQSVTDVENIANVISNYKNTYNNELIFVSFIGGNLVLEGKKILKENDILHYDFPENAIFLYSKLLKQKSWELEKIEDKVDFILPNELEILKEKLSKEQKFCSNDLTGEILSSFDINYSKEILVIKNEDIESAYEKINSKLLAARISSPDIPHKSDVGGVILNISSKNEAISAYEKILENIEKNCSGAKISGVTFARMVTKKKNTQEIFIGFKRDKSFGNIMFVGLGGIYVNVFEDVSMRIGIVSKYEILNMIKELKSFPILEGVRGQIGIDFEKLIDIVFALQFVFKEFDEITEIDINPVFTDDIESIVIDAKFYL